MNTHHNNNMQHYDRKSMNGIEPLPPPSTKGACPLHHMDTFDLRLITPLAYFHEKLSEGLKSLQSFA
jgi:hypothetical protein